MYDREFLWTAYAMYTYFKYGYEKIPVNIWFHKYYSSFSDKVYKLTQHIYNYTFGNESIQSFDFLGKLSWDSKRKVIDAVPLVITNIKHYKN